MKKLVWTSFCLLISLSTYSQSNISIAGQIFDEESKSPLPFVSVAIFTQTDELTHGGITTEEGLFSIQGLEPGNYKMVIRSVGYKPLERDILIGNLNENYDFGKIYLAAATTELEDIVITGDREEISGELNKKSYDIGEGIAQSGGSVMDAMKAMPSVSFDQDGKVILRGSDKVIVLIDGKQSSLTGYGNQKGLDNIPIANIERIEIINNPSAKYDANGMAGIINIIYKKEIQSGLHGSLGFAYGLGALSKRKEDLPTDLGSFSPTPKYIPSLDLNYKKGKSSFFLQSEVLIQKKLPNNEFTTRNYDDGTSLSSQVPENRKQTRYIFKGGLEHSIDKKNILTLSGIYDWESHVDTAQVAYINQDNVRNRYITWNEEEITGYMNYALQYTHKYSQPGHSLGANLQYSRGWEDETYFLNDSSFLRPDGRDVTTVLGVEHITSGTVDYVKPTATGRLETGGKVQIRNLPVEYEQQRDNNSMLYDGLGNWSQWRERIYAAYANWVHEKKDYDIEGGVRAEYTSVSYDMDETNIYYDENDAYDYFRLFPNIRFTYKLNENNRLAAFLNQRIDRPGEPELRMYPKSDDHELVKVGNPYLRPQFTTTFEVAYQNYWKKGSVFVSGYYRRIQDSFQRVYVEDTTSIYDVVIKSYANTGRMQHLGMEVVFSQDISKIWKLSGNFNLYQITITGYEGSLLFPYPQTFEIQDASDMTWDAKIINTFSIREDLEFQLTGIYFADRAIPQGTQFSRSSVDIGVKKSLWDGKGEITLAATDLFNRFGLRQEIDGQGFVADYQNFYETQTIRIAMKYKF